MEERATHKVDARSTAKFLYEQVISRYGCPLELISDRGSHFLNEVIVQLTSEFMIIHKKSSSYYPQGNGQAKSTNKTLCRILTKMVEANHGDWKHKLTATLWAYRTAKKLATHCTPFSLAFKLEAVMPMEYLVPSLRAAVHERLTEESLTERLIDLEQLKETQIHAAYGMKVEKLRQKMCFD